MILEMIAAAFINAAYPPEPPQPCACMVIDEACGCCNKPVSKSDAPAPLPSESAVPAIMFLVPLFDTDADIPDTDKGADGI